MHPWHWDLHGRRSTPRSTPSPLAGPIAVTLRKPPADPYPHHAPGQYRRDGVVFRPLRDAPPITVQMIWRRHDPHPSMHAAIALLTELYRRPRMGAQAGLRVEDREES